MACNLSRRAPHDGATPPALWGLQSLQPRRYQPAEIDFMRQVANQVAVAVDNALNAEDARAAEKQLAHERDRQRMLLRNNAARLSLFKLRLCRRQRLFRAPSFSTTGRV